MRTVFLSTLIGLLPLNLTAQNADTNWVVFDTSFVEAGGGFDNNMGKKKRLLQRFDLEPKSFTVFGISIPIAATGTLGYPHSRLDFSFFTYVQPQPNRAFRFMLSYGNCYDLYHLDIPVYPTGDLKFYYTRYKPSELSKTVKPKSTIVGYNGKERVYYSIEQQYPLNRQFGFTYGCFLTSQVSISTVPFLSPGVSIGIARRNFGTRESQLTGTKKVEFRSNRLFYANLEITCYNYRYIPVNNTTYLRGAPVGVHIGWYFMNSNITSLKRFQGTWNIEMGIRSPIILETANNDAIMPMLYFAYRYYLGAYDLKL